MVILGNFGLLPHFLYSVLRKLIIYLKKYFQEFHASCPAGVSIVKLNSTQKQLLVDEHNLKRAKLASGQVINVIQKFLNKFSRFS